MIGSGTFSRRQGQIYMDMTISNKAMQAMGQFAIQFNKNRYRKRDSDCTRKRRQFKLFKLSEVIEAGSSHDLRACEILHLNHLTLDQLSN